MADLVQLSRGALPWEPTPASSLVAVYNEYDQPLLGVIRQAGTDFLFDCVWGHVESLSVWIYSHVTERELQELDAADGASFDKIKLAAQCRSRATVALVVEGAGIVESAVAESFPHDLDGALSEAVEKYTAYVRVLEQGQSDTEQLMATRLRMVATA